MKGTENEMIKISTYVYSLVYKGNKLALLNVRSSVLFEALIAYILM